MSSVGMIEQTAGKGGPHADSAVATAASARPGAPAGSPT